MEEEKSRSVVTASKETFSKRGKNNGQERPPIVDKSQK